MDSKTAGLVTSKGLKFAFWEEISGKEKKMPGAEAKQITTALKSYQRLGISPDGKVDAPRYEKAEDAAAIVAALDAVEKPMRKVYTTLKGDKHWKKAIENYGVMLTTIRSLVEANAGDVKGDAPVSDSPKYAVPDVEGNLKKVESGLAAIKPGLAALDAKYEPLIAALGALDEPGVDIKTMATKGAQALRDVVTHLMVQNKAFGDLQTAYQAMADPAEINPVDKRLGEYRSRHAAAAKLYADTKKALDEQKKLTVDNQKLLAAAEARAKGQQEPIEKALNEDLLGNQWVDDKGVEKKVVQPGSEQWKRSLDIAQKAGGKMKILFYTVGEAKKTIEELTSETLALSGTKEQRLQQLKSIGPRVKALGEEVKKANKSVAAAEQSLKLLTDPGKLDFPQGDYERDYTAAYNAMPKDVKRARDEVKSATEGFRGLLDTVTQMKQAVLLGSV